MSMLKVETSHGYKAFDELLIMHLEDLMGDAVLFPWDEQYSIFLLQWTGKLHGKPSVIVNCNNFNEMPKILRFCLQNSIMFSFFDEIQLTDTNISDKLLIYYPRVNKGSTTSNPDINKRLKSDIILDFKDFLCLTISDIYWESLFQQPEFALLINKYYPEYGSLIFKDIVDLISKDLKITVKNLLHKFSVFLNQYQDFESWKAVMFLKM